jgi:hypothetical protein
MDHEIPEVESPKFTISAPPAPVIQEPPKKVPIIGAVDRLGPIDRYLDAEQKDHLLPRAKNDRRTTRGHEGISHSDDSASASLR